MPPLVFRGSHSSLGTLLLLWLWPHLSFLFETGSYYITCLCYLLCSQGWPETQSSCLGCPQVACTGESLCPVYLSCSYSLSPFMPLPHLSLPKSNLCASTLYPSVSRVLCPQQGPNNCLVAAAAPWMLVSSSTRMPAQLLSFSTSLCQCPTQGPLASPKLPPYPPCLPTLVHAHGSPGLDVCPSFSAFTALALWVPLPRPGSQGHQKPSLWVEVRGTQVAPASAAPFWTLAGSAGRGRAGYHRASLSVGGT
jgi:hypothetical protein